MATQEFCTGISRRIARFVIRPGSSKGGVTWANGAPRPKVYAWEKTSRFGDATHEPS
ncbi:hypothetical protein D3C87_807660 [compost metagenome]